MAGFRQKNFNSLAMQDPSVFLATDSVSSGWGFSIEIQDVYRLLAHNALIQWVSDCIMRGNDEVAFRNTRGRTLKCFFKTSANFTSKTLTFASFNTNYRGVHWLEGSPRP